jgi:hypothetical protein
MPLSSAVCAWIVSTAFCAIRACRSIRDAKTRIVTTMIAATITTTTPSDKPMYQEVVSEAISTPVGSSSRRARRLST